MSKRRLRRLQSNQAWQATALTIFGVLVCAICTNGLYANYIRPFWRPWMFGVGGLVTAIGLWSLIAAVSGRSVAGVCPPASATTEATSASRATRVGADRSRTQLPADSAKATANATDTPAKSPSHAHSHSHAGHSHSHAFSPRAQAVVLLFPVALICLAAPSPLGAAMLTNTTNGSTVDVARAKTANVGAGSNSGAKAGTGASSGANSKASSAGDFVIGVEAKYPQLALNTVHDITLDEIADRVNYTAPSELNERKVKIVGFVAHDNLKDSRGVWTINRFKIWCCAADATAYSAPVADTEDLPDDTWVEITATISISNGNDLILTHPTVKKIPQPQEPYL